jgi:hypothetical protein
MVELKIEIAPCSPVEVDRRFNDAYFIISATTMEIHTSETSVYFNETTRCRISDGCHLHSRRRENLKSQVDKFIAMRTSNST